VRIQHTVARANAPRRGTSDYREVVLWEPNGKIFELESMRSGFTTFRIHDCADVDRTRGRRLRGRFGYFRRFWGLFVLDFVPFKRRILETQTFVLGIGRCGIGGVLFQGRDLRSNLVLIQVDRDTIQCYSSLKWKPSVVRLMQGEANRNEQRT
jgi:hypothetical protein